MNNPQSKDTVNSLVESIRFSLCSPEFLDKVEREELFKVIKETQAWVRWREDQGLVRGDHLRKQDRPRGSHHLLMVHHDASSWVQGYDADQEAWREVAELPAEAGYEYSAVASWGSKFFLVGGRSRDGRSLRSEVSQLHKDLSRCLHKPV